MKKNRRDRVEETYLGNHEKKTCMGNSVLLTNMKWLASHENWISICEVLEDSIHWLELYTVLFSISSTNYGSNKGIEKTT